MGQTDEFAASLLIVRQPARLGTNVTLEELLESAERVEQCPSGVSGWTLFRTATGKCRIVCIGMGEHKQLSGAVPVR